MAALHASNNVIAKKDSLPEHRRCFGFHVLDIGGLQMARNALAPSGNITHEGKSHYVTPNELMQRWQCSRASVDRIARREGLHRLMLGSGKNGMVRYVRSEVELLESRSIA